MILLIVYVCTTVTRWTIRNPSMNSWCFKLIFRFNLVVCNVVNDNYSSFIRYISCRLPLELILYLAYGISNRFYFSKQCLFDVFVYTIFIRPIFINLNIYNECWENSKDCVFLVSLVIFKLKLLDANGSYLLNTVCA